MYKNIASFVMELGSRFEGGWQYHYQREGLQRDDIYVHMGSSHSFYSFFYRSNKAKADSAVSPAVESTAMASRDSSCM